MTVAMWRRIAVAYAKGTKESDMTTVVDPTHSHNHCCNHRHSTHDVSMSMNTSPRKCDNPCIFVATTTKMHGPDVQLDPARVEPTSLGRITRSPGAAKEGVLEREHGC